MENYERLTELLRKEKFPHSFLFKFIGKNAANFKKGVQDLAACYPQLSLESKKESANQKFLSFSYRFQANSPEEIIKVYQSIGTLPDLVAIL